MLHTLRLMPAKHLEVIERIDRLRDRLRFLLQGQPRRLTRITGAVVPDRVACCIMMLYRIRAVGRRA